jgi:hypothetical protein
LCAGLKLRDQIDSVLTLGHLAAISCVVTSGDTGYLPRSQAALKFAGHISGIDATKAAARLVGQRGGTGRTTSSVWSLKHGCISMTGPAPCPCWFTADPPRWPCRNRTPCTPNADHGLPGPD